jgi:hypothetical protein
MKRILLSYPPMGLKLLRSHRTLSRKAGTIMMGYLLSLAAMSRRRALAGLATGGMSADLAQTLPHATAQHASPAATAFPMADHPVIGVWAWLDPTDPSNAYAYATFTEEGTYTEAWSLRFGLALGSWRATGERTADLVYTQQPVIAPDVFDPDRVMEGHALKPPTSASMSVWRLALTVDANGNTLNQVGGFDAYDMEGRIVHSHEFDGIGTRMVIVPA